MADEEYLKIEADSASLQTHLGILQNVIQRMAANSASCKAWCISLVAAVLVVVADKDNPDYAFIAIIPNALFAFLDAYYLALEKGFRTTYNSFVSKAHKGTITENDLFSVDPTGSMNILQLKALVSFSVWGFYVPLLISVILMWYLVL